MTQNGMVDGVVAEIYSQCIGIDRTPTAPVVVIFDDFGKPLAEAFARYGGSQGVSLIAIYCHYRQQLQLLGSRTSRIYAVIRNSDVLLNIVSSLDDCLDFRVGVITEAVRSGLKILHLPGVTGPILLRGSKGLDYGELHGRAAKVADMLSHSRSVTVRTKAASEVEHELEIPIEERSGHACGGIAERGEIMNLPTGESYIAPVEGEVSGSVVINGSGPSCVFHGDDEVILAFEKGRLNWDECVFSSSPESKHLQEKLSQCCADEPDTYQLGEFGVGLNRSIKTLCGEVILDEKKAGTAHIAMGNNSPFGGRLTSSHHHDLVFVPESIVLDQRELDDSLWR